MARQQTTDFQQIIEAAIEGVIRRLSARILAAAEDLAKKKAPRRRGAPVRRRPARARRAPEELTHWTTDRRARRVPRFVIEMTGLDTKKKLVAKYGENVTFRRGQALPPLKGAPPPVVAKPPRIRKAGAA